MFHGWNCQPFRVHLKPLVRYIHVHDVWSAMFSLLGETILWAPSRPRKDASQPEEVCEHAILKMNVISSVFALVSDRSSPEQSNIGNLRLSKVAETGTEMSRQEVTVKLLSTLLGLATSCAITYFGVRWLVNAMDPTHREKKAARKKVTIWGIIKVEKSSLAGLW